MREDSVTSPKLGSDHKVWVMEVPTWVNIIPLTPEGEVVLVNQYRFGTEQASLETQQTQEMVMILKDLNQRLLLTVEMMGLT